MPPSARPFSSTSKRRNRHISVAVPTNKLLYAQVVREAKKTFHVWPSAYASGWVVNEYKARGGTYTSSAPKHSQHSRRSSSPSSPSSSLRRWFDEVWIDVCHWPTIVPCGRGSRDRESSGRRSSRDRKSSKQHSSQYRKFSKRQSSHYPYCRPLYRISSQTPKTVRELTSKERKRRCRKKRQSPYKRLL